MTEMNKAEWVQSLLQNYEGPLLRYAFRLSGDPAFAQDVVQDTFLRLWKADAAQLEGHTAEWLFTVCRHRIFDRQRKERRMIPVEEHHLEITTGAQPPASETMDRAEETQRVFRLVEGLSPKHREVVRLKFQNDLSYKEISHITKLSVTNVGFILHTAIKTLRAQMREGNTP